MGRKTFDSLPSILPGRMHIVLSSQSTPDNLIENPHVVFLKTTQDVLEYASHLHTEQTCVIGGAQIYKILAPYCTSFLITHMDTMCQADTHFPLELLNNRHIIKSTPLDGPSFLAYKATIREYGSLIS